jgi:hypothetical protein
MRGAWLKGGNEDKPRLEVATKSGDFTLQKLSHSQPPLLRSQDAGICIRAEDSFRCNYC